MTQDVDKSIDLLKLLLSKNPSEGSQDDFTGFKVLRVVSTEPSPYAFVFEGTEIALDIDLFEIPISAYPLALGDTFFVFPIVGNGMRWAVFQKINQSAVIADVISTSRVQVPGVGRSYGASDIMIPENLTLEPGKQVTLQPVAIGDGIKYIVTNMY